MGNGGGFGWFGWFFLAWHVVQPLMYSVTSFFMAGHQKSRAIAQVVFEIPGCPATLQGSVRLDLSLMATAPSLGTLDLKLALQILSEG